MRTEQQVVDVLKGIFVIEDGLWIYFETEEQRFEYVLGWSDYTDMPDESDINSDDYDNEDEWVKANEEWWLPYMDLEHAYYKEQYRLLKTFGWDIDTWKGYQ